MSHSLNGRADSPGSDLKSPALATLSLAVEDERSGVAQSESETHLKMIVLELKHRVKNSLATVQAIAAQTLTGHQPLNVAREAFMQRISALAIAHDILTREQWEGLGIEQIARAVLDPLARHRISLTGGPVEVAPKAGLAIAMALHELGTNALKYGALSVPEGRVTLTWGISGADDEVTLCWTETGGPPVTPPTRRGFGSRLLERGLAGELSGRVLLDFRRSGVICTIAGPMQASRRQPEAASAG